MMVFCEIVMGAYPCLDICQLQRLFYCLTEQVCSDLNDGSCVVLHCMLLYLGNLMPHVLLDVVLQLKKRKWNCIWLKEIAVEMTSCFVFCS